jgi:hypothetical protein
VTDFTATENGSYTLTENDRLLMPASFKTQDKNGVAIAKGSAGGDFWTYEYRGASGVLNVKANSAALRFAGMAGSLYAYTLPVQIVEVKTAAATQADAIVYTQRNGPSLSNSMNGYYEDVQRFVAEYVTVGKARAMRIPFHHDQLVKDGVVQDSILLGGYQTKQWPALKAIIDFDLQNDCAVVLDDHKFGTYDDPAMRSAWVAIGEKLMATYGDNDKIILEPMNETSSGGWQTGWAANVQSFIKMMRDAGVTYRFAIGWGNWNAIGSYARALAEIDALTGPLDPLNKVDLTAHHYPTTSGNDQAKSGQSLPQINGGAVSSQFAPMLDEFKRRGLKVWISEIGMGGGVNGWLANGSGVPAFDGKAWFDQFTALIAKYPDTVAGVLAWGGGSAWVATYPFKMTVKDQWTQTEASEAWQRLSAFWQNKHLVPAT